MPILKLISEIKLMCTQLMNVAPNMNSDQVNRLFIIREQIRDILRELGGVSDELRT